MIGKKFWNLSFSIADVIKLVTGTIGVLAVYFSTVSRIDTEVIQIKTELRDVRTFYSSDIQELKSDVKEIKTDIKDLLRKR